MIDLFIPVNNIMPIYLNMIEYDLCHLGCPKGMKTKRVLISWVFFLFLSSYSMQMTDVVVLNFEVVTVFHVMSYFDSIRYNMDHFLSSLSLWQAKCYKYLTKTKSHQIKTSTMERMHARTTESKISKASSLNYADFIQISEHCSLLSPFRRCGRSLPSPPGTGPDPGQWQGGDLVRGPLGDCLWRLLGQHRRQVLRWPISKMLLWYAHCCSVELVFLLCWARFFSAEHLYSLPSIFFFSARQRRTTTRQSRSVHIREALYLWTTVQVHITTHGAGVGVVACVWGGGLGRVG